MKKSHVSLTDAHRKDLEKILSKGTSLARTFKRATGLLELDNGQTYVATAVISKLSSTSLVKLSKRYASEGLACLYDNPRPGRPIKITAKQRDQITVLACESSPVGSSQWSLRLLADKVVELGYCDSISHSQVGEILKKENKTSPS
ncbi:MAG: helix-turn-helix domain-containing protein [Melioribacteraceae bacterium]